MGGGIMQLMSVGRQNKYITGNPQTTYFKAVYYRHTNFAMETIPSIFNNSISVNSDSNVKAIVQRSGDLVSGAHIEFEICRTENSSKLTGGSYINWTNSTGYALLKEVRFEIGSEVIDSHYSEWFDIWNELTDVTNSEHIMVNKHNAKECYLLSDNDIGSSSKHSLKCYVPLQFWFCKNPGLAFPLIALQNKRAYINVLLRNPRCLLNTDHTTNTIGTLEYTQEPTLYIDYIYLDTKERRSFATKNHQYLIETLEYNGSTNFSNNHELNFNNPIKEVIWVIRNKNVSTENKLELSSDYSGTKTDSYSNNINGLNKNNDYFNYSIQSANSQEEYLYAAKVYEPFKNAELFMNGNSRFNKRNATYFRTIQPLNYHSKVPLKHIYIYSFSLKPEEHQPSGVCNFSKLKKVELKFENPNTSNTEILIFGVAYNLLRFKGGLAGLAYGS
jgi:hypothetical protein